MKAEEDPDCLNACIGEKSSQERSHSPDPSVWSLKSDKSMKTPIQLKDGNDRDDQSSEERSHSPDPSVWSLKSDKSMRTPIQLKDGNDRDDQSFEERSHSPDPSVWSLKSDKSMKTPIQLKDGDSRSDQSLQQKQHSCDSNATQRIHSEDKTNLSHQRCDSLIHDSQIQQRLKSNVKIKHKYVSEGLGKQGNPVLLSEIYTELYIIEDESGEIRNKHEFTRMERTFTPAGETKPIRCSDIFTPLPGQDKDIRTVLTKGVAGIGKTVSVQKFILDWAEGTENQDVQLIFPLPFREINLMKDKTLSLSDLLHVFFPETREMNIFSDRYKVLFIFDGLDECRFPLNFHTNETLRDVTKETSVDELLTNLIVGNLLPSALIWITSRPAAADLVPSECVHRVTEVRGFSDPQKEEYFRKRITDHSLADRIISHLKSSRSLYIMCQIPVFCWISATVLEKMMSEDTGQIPKTLTDMYTHFLILQINIRHDKDYEKKVTDEDVILKLGKLAFEQLVKGNLIFYEEDLRECGIDVTEASVYSGLCTQIFREEFGLYQGKVFSFVHLSVQEHLAALHVHLSFINMGKNVLVESDPKKESETNVTMSTILKCAVKKTIESKTGHLDLFLRFLVGLSLKSNQVLLERFYKTQSTIHEDTVQTIEYLKEMIRTCCPEMSIVLFHCLNELNDHSLNNEIQRYITSGETKEIKSQELGLALMFILMTSDEKFDEFELRQYGRSDDILAWLTPVIKLSTKARLHDCNITQDGCLSLCLLLSSLSNVKELDLSNNNLLDVGVEILCVGPRSSKYAIQKIKQLFGLDQNKVTDPRHDAYICSTAALQDMDCRLETLILRKCGVTEAGCVFLSSALSLNPSHLKVLDLSYNNIGDSGVKHLCAALEKHQCALDTLRLDGCGMTERSCPALSSALSSNTSSLTDLDLSDNDLQDSGLKRLCVGLQSPHCKLQKLRLSSCNVTREGVSALTEALKSSPSHLKEISLDKTTLKWFLRYWTNHHKN